MTRIYRLQPDTEDLRDRLYYPSSIKSASKLPSSVDLRPYCSPIVD